MPCPAMLGVRHIWAAALIESKGNINLKCSAVYNCRGSWVLVAQRSCTANPAPAPYSQPARQRSWGVDCRFSSAQELAPCPRQVGRTAAHLSPIACLFCW